LLKTKDKRKFLTYKKNLPLLIEFARAFEAEISLIRLKNEEKIDVFELENLAPAICNANYIVEPNYEILEKILPQNKKPKTNNNHHTIQKFIINRLKKGHTVSLEQLRKKFKNQRIANTTLCNHFSTSRKNLEKEGYSIVKLKAGEYCLED
jgi:hypothetical protein